MVLFHIISLLIILLLPSAALFANMANPDQPGDLISEPFGSLDSIDILHEDLVIDLRPVATPDGKGIISARYVVLNRGAKQNLPMIFVLGSVRRGSGTYAVTIDGQLISAHSETDLQVPASWSPPDSIPSPTSGDLIPYVSYYDGNIVAPQPGAEGRDSSVRLPCLTFNLIIPPGRHEIVVTYDAVISESGEEPPVKIWQFGYVLSPARKWGSFGDLEATVRYPEGWDWATAPAMKQTEEGVLKIRWEGLPADHLGVSIRPVPPHPLIELLAIGLPPLLSGLALTLAAIYNSRRLARRTNDRERKRPVLWIAATIIGLLTLPTLIMYSAIHFSLEMTHLLMDDYAVNNYRYMGGIPELILFVVLVPVTGLISYLNRRSILSRRSRAHENGVS